MKLPKFSGAKNRIGIASPSPTVFVKVSTGVARSHEVVSMKFFLGVDGGQSSTTAIIGDENGKTVGWATSGPCNHVAAAEARARFLRVMRECISQAAHRAGLE